MKMTPCCLRSSLKPESRLLGFCDSSEPQPVVHVVSTREHDWTEQEVSVESSPTIIYQEVSGGGGEAQSATSTIKALLELQQTTGEPKSCVVIC